MKPAAFPESTTLHPISPLKQRRERSNFRNRQALLGRARPDPERPSEHLKEWYWESLRDLLSDKQHSRLARRLPKFAGPVYVPPEKPPVLDLPDTRQCVETQVDGVVYVSVFNPKDGRKNWHHLITAFCWAFREVDDATLVLRSPTTICLFITLRCSTCSRNCRRSRVAWW